MSGKNTFVAAPDLSTEKAAAPAKSGTNIALEPASISDRGLKGAPSGLLSKPDPGSTAKGTPLQAPHKRISPKTAEKNAPRELNDALKRTLSDKLSGSAPSPIPQKAVISGPKNRIIIRFVAFSKNISCDIEIPLDITANDLIVGLNQAYDLGIDVSDAHQCYLSCESPVALLKGKRLLGEYGIRDGSLLICYR